MDKQEIDYKSFNGLDDSYLFTIENPFNPLMISGNEINTISIDGQFFEDAVIDNNRCCLIS